MPAPVNANSEEAKALIEYAQGLARAEHARDAAIAPALTLFEEAEGEAARLQCASHLAVVFTDECEKFNQRMYRLVPTAQVARPAIDHLEAKTEPS